MSERLIKIIELDLEEPFVRQLSDSEKKRYG